MSLIRRKVALLECDTTGEISVHCENENGQMRCELCGTIKKEQNCQKMILNI